jgi:hypothetical protein
MLYISFHKNLSQASKGVHKTLFSFCNEFRNELKCMKVTCGITYVMEVPYVKLKQK